MNNHLYKKMAILTLLLLPLCGCSTGSGRVKPIESHLAGSNFSIEKNSSYISLRYEKAGNTPVEWVDCGGGFTVIRTVGLNGEVVGTESTGHAGKPPSLARLRKLIKKTVENNSDLFFNDHSNVRALRLAVKEAKSIGLLAVLPLED